jgi:hypothetical protein
MLATPAEWNELCAEYLIGAPKPLDNLAGHSVRYETIQSS